MLKITKLTKIVQVVLNKVFDFIVFLSFFIIMDFNKKQKGGLLKEFFLRLGAFFVIVIVIFLIIADIRIYNQGRELKDRISKYESRISEIKEQNKKLENEIANSDNPDYIEKVAREEQGMQKEGETAVSFVFPQNASPKNAPAAGEFENLDWLASLINWIKGLF